MVIRTATAPDMSHIRGIAERAYAKYVQRIRRQPAPMVADFEAHVARDEIHVAETDACISGFIVFYPRAEDFFIENVAVDPGFAGRGIGKALMAYAEAAAVDAGCRIMRLYTNVKMHENFPFYEALGYRKTHEVTEAGFRRAYFEKKLEQP